MCIVLVDSRFRKEFKDIVRKMNETIVRPAFGMIFLSLKTLANFRPNARQMYGTRRTRLETLRDSEKYHHAKDVLLYIPRMMKDHSRSIFSPRELRTFIMGIPFREGFFPFLSWLCNGQSIYVFLLCVSRYGPCT